MFEAYTQDAFSWRRKSSPWLITKEELWDCVVICVRRTSRDWEDPPCRGETLYCWNELANSSKEVVCDRLESTGIRTATHLLDLATAIRTELTGQHCPAVPNTGAWRGGEKIISPQSVTKGSRERNDKRQFENRARTNEAKETCV